MIYITFFYNYYNWHFICLICCLTMLYGYFQRGWVL